MFSDVDNDERGTLLIDELCAADVGRCRQQVTWAAKVTGQSMTAAVIDRFKHKTFVCIVICFPTDSNVPVWRAATELAIHVAKVLTVTGGTAVPTLEEVLVVVLLTDRISCNRSSPRRIPRYWRTSAKRCSDAENVCDESSCSASCVLS